MSRRTAPILAISGAVIDIAEGGGVGRSVVAHAAGLGAGIGGGRLVLFFMKSAGTGAGMITAAVIGIGSAYLAAGGAGQAYDEVMTSESALEKLRAQVNEDQWSPAKILKDELGPYYGPM